MNENTPVNLAWLDRLRMSVPNYSGYDSRGDRRSAAFALRDVLSQRLSAVRTQLDRAISSCEREKLHSEVQALDRVGHHLDRIIQRIGGLGTRLGGFYSGPDLSGEVLTPVYSIDHSILDRVDALAKRFETPGKHHDMLAMLVSDLNELEDKLDERAILLRKLK